MKHRHASILGGTMRTLIAHTRAATLLNLVAQRHAGPRLHRYESNPGLTSKRPSSRRSEATVKHLELTLLGEPVRPQAAQPQRLKWLRPNVTLHVVTKKRQDSRSLTETSSFPSAEHLSTTKMRQDEKRRRWTALLLSGNTLAERP